MIALISILVFSGIVLFIATYLARRNKNEEVEIVVNDEGECCGMHEVCERDSLLTSNTKVEYFDDEELDVLAGIAPEEYTDKQVKELSDVFYSMKESDVASWLKSLQLRKIQLPAFLKEEALMIVGERRN